MGWERLELSWPCGRQVLNLLRLPIPPRALEVTCEILSVMVTTVGCDRHSGGLRNLRRRLLSRVVMQSCNDIDNEASHACSDRYQARKDLTSRYERPTGERADNQGQGAYAFQVLRHVTVLLGLCE
jgi:hypothetical protein